MSVYMIVEVKDVTDKKRYGEYIQKVPQTVAKFGGKYLVRGGRAKSVSGERDPGRIIIVEFESMDKFNAWWSCPEYRALAPLREGSAKTDAVVVEGV